MKLRIIKKEQQVESNWSGGKTRQLAIFPESASYLDRDFIWRLSTADSDREESSFSRLEGYDRILMVLEGDVVLAHGDERTAHLAALEQDRFDGGVKTRCFGQLKKDYNLIMARGCAGSLEVMDVSAKATDIGLDPADDELPEGDRYRSVCVYVLEGYAVVTCDSSSEMVREGEQGVVELAPGEEPTVHLMGEGKCILARVAFATGEEASEARIGSEGAGGESVPEGSGSFFSEYGTCLRLFFRSNKWSKMLRREGGDKVYYDKPLATALSRLERRYVTTIVWAVGTFLCLSPIIFDMNVLPFIGLAAVFTLVHLFFIAPFIYWRSLPRPVRAHMKPVEEMDVFEKAHHAEAIADNPQLEKLMRKYKSDDENYFADESSILYRLVKKK